MQMSLYNLLKTFLKVYHTWSRQPYEEMSRVFNDISNMAIFRVSRLLKIQSNNILMTPRSTSAIWWRMFKYDEDIQHLFRSYVFLKIFQFFKNIKMYFNLNTGKIIYSN
jgi:hypothetical protein